MKLVIHNDCGEGETTLGIKVKNSTSVSEHHLDVSLFPNPADDMITINIANPIDKIRIEIYNGILLGGSTFPLLSQDLLLHMSDF